MLLLCIHFLQNKHGICKVFRINLPIMPQYSNLSIETLESLLKTHEDRLIQLVADRQTPPKKIVDTQEAIIKIKSAIRANEEFGCFKVVN